MMQPLGKSVLLQQSFQCIVLNLLFSQNWCHRQTYAYKKIWNLMVDLTQFLSMDGIDC